VFYHELRGHGFIPTSYTSIICIAWIIPLTGIPPAAYCSLRCSELCLHGQHFA
jgi:hypothetical protein